MKTAYVIIDKEKVFVDPWQYLRMATADKNLVAQCPGCDHPVFLNNKNLAKTFCLNSGLARGPGAKPVGFSHYHKNPNMKDGKICPYYYPPTPGIGGVRGEDFSLWEKRFSSLYLQRPKTREAISAGQRFFMRLLTGKDEISPEDRAALDKEEMKLITTPGISSNLFLLAFLPVARIGSHRRVMSDKQEQEIEFFEVGEERLLYIGLDGREHRRKIPAKMGLYGYDGPMSGPRLKRFNEGTPVEFPVSYPMAIRIIERELKIEYNHNKRAVPPGFEQLRADFYRRKRGVPPPTP